MRAKSKRNAFPAVLLCECVTLIVLAFILAIVFF